MTSSEPVNPLRRIWRAGGTATGVGLTIGAPALAQLLARTGFDWLMIDMEHGAVSAESVHAMIAATAATPVAPIVRLPQNLPWLAKPALDCWGAFGIVYPTVDTAADAAAAAHATRYPPEGGRQWGPFHAPARFGMAIPDYLRRANDEVVTIVIIETPEAIENIEQIVATDGVDAAVLGSHDLAVAMAHPGQPDHPDVACALRHAERVIRDSEVVLGDNAFSPTQARQMTDRGYQLLALGFDWTLLQRGGIGATERRPA
jgi:4-hydroxy-2-oxoheptanedioate aldolase